MIVFTVFQAVYCGVVYGITWIPVSASCIKADLRPIAFSTIWICRGERFGKHVIHPLGAIFID